MDFFILLSLWYLQVRKAVEKLAACSVAEIFVGAVAFAVFLPGKKEKRTK